MYLILVLFVLLFVCSLFYLSGKEKEKEGFATDFYEMLPVKVTGSGDADYQLSIPNKIVANRDSLPIEFGGGLITTGKLEVKGSELRVDNHVNVGQGVNIGQGVAVGKGMTVGEGMTVTGTINAGNVFKNSHNALPPVGSITAYVGKVEPDGWVFCDGVERTNDGRYNALLTMEIGEGTPNGKYKPPNLKNQFLKGSDTDENLRQFVPKGVINLSVDHLPAHTHTGSIGYMNQNQSHSHRMASENSDLCGTKTGDHNMSDWDNDGGNELHFYGQGLLRDKDTGVKNIDHTHSLTINATGSGTGYPVPDPAHFTVHYILKY